LEIWGELKIERLRIGRLRLKKWEDWEIMKIWKDWEIRRFGDLVDGRFRDLGEFRDWEIGEIGRLVIGRFREI